LKVRLPGGLDTCIVKSLTTTLPFRNPYRVEKSGMGQRWGRPLISKGLSVYCTKERDGERLIRQARNLAPGNVRSLKGGGGPDVLPIREGEAWPRKEVYSYSRKKKGADDWDGRKGGGVDKRAQVFGSDPVRVKHPCGPRRKTNEQGERVGMEGDRLFPGGKRSSLSRGG